MSYPMPYLTYSQHGSPGESVSWHYAQSERSHTNQVQHTLAVSRCMSTSCLPPFCFLSASFLPPHASFLLPYCLLIAICHAPFLSPYCFHSRFLSCLPQASFLLPSCRLPASFCLLRAFFMLFFPSALSLLTPPPASFCAF